MPPQHTYCPMTGVVDGSRRTCERTSLFHDNHWVDVDGRRWHWSDRDPEAWPGEDARLDWIGEQRQLLRDRQQPAVITAA